MIKREVFQNTRQTILSASNLVRETFWASKFSQKHSRVSITTFLICYICVDSRRRRSRTFQAKSRLKAEQILQEKATTNCASTRGRGEVLSKIRASKGIWSGCTMGQSDLFRRRHWRAVKSHGSFLSKGGSEEAKYSKWPAFWSYDHAKAQDP